MEGNIMEEERRNYTVYAHITPDGKAYVGCTGQNILRRWKNGTHYSNKRFNAAILKYGWDNIEHRIIKSGLTFEEAKVLESKYIAEFDSRNPNKGYNVMPGGRNNYEARCNARGYSSRDPVRVQCVETGIVYPSIMEAERQTCAHQPDITRSLQGKRSFAGGYHWRRID